MSRKSIFERIAEQKVNLNVEKMKIHSFLENNRYLYTDLSFGYKKSPISHCFPEFSTFVLSILNKTNFTAGDYLDLAELIYTAKIYATIEYSSSVDCQQMIKTISFVVSKIGYKMVEVDGVAKAKEINPIASAVSSVVPSNVSDKIENYLYIRAGNISEKRKCLKSLSDDFDLIKPKVKSLDEFKKLSELEQCIRHPKEEKIVSYPFFFEREEYWMDKLFEMFLAAFAYYNSKEIYKEIMKKITK